MSKPRCRADYNLNLAVASDKEIRVMINRLNRERVQSPLNSNLDLDLMFRLEEKWENELKRRKLLHKALNFQRVQ
ncbi:MAG: hypothetical protein KGI54_15810 [Pseudomonadota bacterium]|nr:hypothetical protein [Pseudomonadota bacterium]